MQGRRVFPDADGFLPKDFGAPGDYGKLGRTLEQVLGCENQLWWKVNAPDGSGCTLNPKIHEVVEHDDGTISVVPSIITSTWHGWLVQGIWKSV